MELSAKEISAIRKKWRRDPSFLGFPDAERDAGNPAWHEHLLVRPRWFTPATKQSAALVVGRKGVGKSASRIAAAAQMAGGSGNEYVVEASADELAARHAERLKTAANRGYGAVADWCHVFAELIVRNVATKLGGTLITGDDEEKIRRWAVMAGISERDFGERLASAVSSIVPWAKRLTEERGGGRGSDERIQRVANARSFVLYIDDFDNVQEVRSPSNTRLVRDAVEAADRITHRNPKASVHLLMRQDLWLRLRPGWHYADKIAGLVELNWSQEDLAQWVGRRLRLAASEALGVTPDRLSTANPSQLWAIFFPEEVALRNEKTSSGLHYLVRRTMYTPRALRQFMELIVTHSSNFPANLRDIEDAEDEFSRDQLEFLKTEFGGLCHGLDICLQSFTSKPLEWVASDLYRHLNGLIGNGQVRLSPGASDGDDAVSVARFLFRIGFLEVRYPQQERYEVRDSMRHPEHWKSIRKDDAVRWAVRSAFYCALRAHR